MYVCFGITKQTNAMFFVCQLMKMADVVHNIFHRIRSFCTCSREEDNESEISAVGTVDSVRLVYMRQIEEATSSTAEEVSQIDAEQNQISNEQAARMNKHRKQKEYALEALQRALEEYELKNVKIMSKTKVPRSVSSTKSTRASQGSQTYSKDVFEEANDTLDDDIDALRNSSGETDEDRIYIREYQVEFEHKNLDDSRRMVKHNLINNGIMIGMKPDILDMDSEISSLTCDNISELTNDS